MKDRARKVLRDSAAPYRIQSIIWRSPSFDDTGGEPFLDYYLMPAGD